MNILTENVSYIIPVEELDLLHLRKYMERPNDRPMKLWSNAQLKGESEYYEVKIISKEMIENPDISYSDVKDNVNNDDRDSIKDNYCNDSDEDSNTVTETTESLSDNSDDTPNKSDKDYELTGVTNHQIYCRYHDNDKETMNKNHNDCDVEIVVNNNNQVNEDSKNNDDNFMYFCKYYERELTKCIEDNESKDSDNKIDIDRKNFDQGNETSSDYSDDGIDDYQSSNEDLNGIKKDKVKIDDQKFDKSSVTRRYVSLKQRFIEFKNNLENTSAVPSLTSNTTHEHQPGHCIVCNEAVLIDSKFHLTSENHRKAASSSVIPVETNLVPASVFCATCNEHIKLTEYFKHLDSKSHLKIIRAQNFISKRASGIYTCNLCEVVLNNIAVKHHLVEKGHLDNLKEMSPAKEFCKTCGFQVKKDDLAQTHKCKPFLVDSNSEKDGQEIPKDYRMDLKDIDENLNLCTRYALATQRRRSDVVRESVPQVDEWPPDIRNGNLC
ncbi:unnamed protein product [Spodoptera exigua]|nr:unnamed protein product [Spodoptera exigua]